MNPLKQWRKANRYTLKGLQELLEAEGCKVSTRTLINWEGGKVPSLEGAEAIRKVTGGQVKPESFLR